MEIDKKKKCKHCQKCDRDPLMCITDDINLWTTLSPLCKKRVKTQYDKDMAWPKGLLNNICEQLKKWFTQINLTVNKNSNNDPILPKCLQDRLDNIYGYTFNLNKSKREPAERRPPKQINKKPITKSTANKKKVSATRSTSTTKPAPKPKPPTKKAPPKADANSPPKSTKRQSTRLKGQQPAKLNITSLLESSSNESSSNESDDSTPNPPPPAKKARTIDKLSKPKAKREASNVKEHQSTKKKSTTTTTKSTQQPTSQPMLKLKPPPAILKLNPPQKTAPTLTLRPINDITGNENMIIEDIPLNRQNINITRRNPSPPANQLEEDNIFAMASYLAELSQRNVLVINPQHRQVADGVNSPRGNPQLQNFIEGIRMSIGDLTNFEVMVIPVHIGYHYTMAIYERATNTLIYTDSLGGRIPFKVMQYITQLIRSLTNQRGLTPNIDYPDCNQQAHTYECGFYSILAAEAYLLYGGTSFIPNLNFQTQFNRIIQLLLQLLNATYPTYVPIMPQ